MVNPTTTNKIDKFIMLAVALGFGLLATAFWRWADTVDNQGNLLQTRLDIIRSDISDIRVAITSVRGNIDISTQLTEFYIEELKNHKQLSAHRQAGEDMKEVLVQLRTVEEMVRENEDRWQRVFPRIRALEHKINGN